MFWIIGIYLVIGLIVAFTIPYSRDVPLRDNIMIMFLWLPVFVWSFIQTAFRKF